MAHVLCTVGCVEPSESFAAESPNTWHPLWSDCPESCVKVEANCNVCSASNREASVSLHSPDRKFAVYQHGLANTNNILLSNTFIRLCEHYMIGIPYSFYVEPMNHMVKLDVAHWQCLIFRWNCYSPLSESSHVIVSGVWDARTRSILRETWETTNHNKHQ